MNVQLSEKKCEFCGNNFPPGSREDKRFCGDNCRNSFNKRKNVEDKLPAHENKSEIIKIIKRNYEFLRKHAPLNDENSYTIMEISKAKDWKEFNPKFYTSSELIDNRTWYFCFDLGFYVNDTHAEFTNRPKQATIS